MNTTPDIKRQFKYWAIFDFANSLIYTNVLLYFPQWLTIEHKVSDFWYNALLAVITLLLLISAPIFGIYADHRKRRVWLLRATSLALLGGGFLIASTAWLNLSTSMLLILGILGFFIISYTYQLSLTFYDAMLGDVSSDENRVRASGIGLSWGWLGAIIGVVLVLPIANGTIAWLPGGRLAAIGCSSLLFLAVGLIPLLKLRDPISEQSVQPTPIASQRYFSHLWRDVRELRRTPTTVLFLLAYWLYIDVILTLQDNLPIYMERVLGLPDSAKAGVVIALTVGGIISALLAARFVAPRRQLPILFRLVLVSTAGLFALSLAHIPSLFFIILCTLALCFGAILALSRSLYTQLVPPSKRTEFFGFYSIAERSASILGPLLWGLTVSHSGFSGTIPYTLAMLVLAFLMGCAVLALYRLQRSCTTLFLKDQPTCKP